MKKEIELKYRLASKDDFILFGHFLDAYATGPKIMLRQENFYFDSSSLSLKRNGMSLRLRRQNNEYIIGAKQSLSQKKSRKYLSMRLEYEGPISNIVAKLIHDGYLSPADAFSSLPSVTPEDTATKRALQKIMKKTARGGLQLIGSFLNERVALPIELLGQGMIIELDHATYPKAIEIFEVEVELASVKQIAIIRPLIENLFHKAQVKTYRSISKSSQLYRILYG
jgi:uncharacterized protein YjbK